MHANKWHEYVCSADRSSQHPIQHLRQRGRVGLAFDSYTDQAHLEHNSTVGIGTCVAR